MGYGRRPPRQYGRRRVQHVVLGLIFLKYISDAFEKAHAKLESERDQGGRPRRRRRVPRPKHLLGAARGALGAPEGASQAANHRVGPACPSRPSWTGTRGSRRKHCACNGGRSCRATRRASTCSSTSSDAASAVRAQFRHSTGVLVQQAWVPVIAEHHLSQENGAMPRKGRDYGAELIRWLRIRAIAAVYHGFPRSSRER